MRVTLIILLVININAADESGSKYIDLLPEKEKEEFLDKIARRILEEVKSNDDVPKGSIELSDAQLSKHDEYVQQVLEEETKILRAKVNQSLNGPSVVSNKNVERTDVDQNRYVDLTLRAEKRDKRESRRVLSEHTEDNAEDAKYENEKGSVSDVDIQVKNFKKFSENTEESIPQDLETAKQTTSNSNEGETTDKTTDKLEKTEITTDTLEETAITTEANLNIDNRFVPQNDEKVSVENDLNKSVQNPPESTAVDNILSSNFNNINSEILSNAEVTGSPQNASLRFSRSYNEDLDLTQNNTLEKDNETKTVNNASELEDSKVIHIDITSTIAHTEETTSSNLEMSTNTDNDDMTDQGKENAHSDPTIEATSMQIKVLTTTPSPTTDKSEDGITTTLKSNLNAGLDTQNKTTPNVNVDSENNDNNTETKQSVHVANEMINILRQNFVGVGPSKTAVHFKDFKSQFQQNSIKEHKVYEIDPDADPFIKQKTYKVKPKRESVKTVYVANKEEPYYVPIYNYSPNNAFYNPHNVFGPNTDSNEETYTAGKINDVDEESDYFISEDYIKDSLGEFKTTNPSVGNRVYTYRLGNNDKNKYRYGNRDTQGHKNFEWDYYFRNDHLRKFKNHNAESHGEKEYKIPVAVHKPTLSDTSFNPNDYLDINYSVGRTNKDNLKSARIGIIKKCKQKCNSCKQTCENSEETNDSYKDSEIKKSVDNNESIYESPITKIRKILLQTNGFRPIEPIKVKDEDTKSVADDKTTLRFKGSYFNDDNKAYYHFANERDVKKSHQRDPIRHGRPLQFYYINNKKNEVKPSHVTGHRKTSNMSSYDLIKQIIDMAPDDSLIPIMLQLEQLDIKKAARRQRWASEMDVFVTVLRDMIKDNNKALAQYAWLETSVELQSAIKKMIDMTDAVSNGVRIHPSDWELLKYIVSLYKLAKEELDDVEKEEILPNNNLRSLLPRNRNKKNNRITKNRLLGQAWMFRMTEKRPISDGVLNEFEQFLDDLQSGLFDLHTALKYIAMVTQYKNQSWFRNLKELNTYPSKKHLLGVLLHLSTTRLLGLVEQSAKKGLEDNYLDYVKKNLEEVARTKEEFVFVLKVIEEIKAVK